MKRREILKAGAAAALGFPAIVRAQPKEVVMLGLWDQTGAFADETLPIVDAEFQRTGNSLSTVEERVVSTGDEIILTWWDLMKPFILTMPPGAMNRPLGVYSTFIPARSAQLSVNGKAAGGKVFPQERSGKASSSCCLAWSESWTKPRG